MMTRPWVPFTRTVMVPGYLASPAGVYTDIVYANRFIGSLVLWLVAWWLWRQKAFLRI